MNSIFLRIYGGLVFTLILSMILCGLAFTITSGIRLQNYREASVQISFRVMAHTLARSKPSTWKNDLTYWEKKLGVSLKTTSDTSLNLRKIWLLRLRQGKLTTRAINNNTFTVYILVNRHTILSGTIHDMGQQFFLGSTEIVRHWIQQFPSSDQGNILQSLINTASYSYPLRISTVHEIPLSPRERGIINNNETALSLLTQPNTIQAYARLNQSDRILHVGPWQLFDLYPFRLLAALSLFVLISMSIATYILVRGLERRVLLMKNAAMEIADGKLDARVHTGSPDAIGKLGMAFNSMAKHLQRLLSIQQEMIHGISHELRTPVARLRFALQMITDAKNQQSLEEQVSGMDNDIEELDELIDEILTYARLENTAPALKLKFTNIETIIRQVVKEQQRLHPNLTISYIKNTDIYMAPYAEAEGRYIQRAIQNIVINACRYAKDRIELQFSHKNNCCHLYIEDDGPGIPINDRETVFNAFSRLDDSRTRSSGGYGLGLSIVRRIMDWHNGTVSIIEAPNLQGACFYLSWPQIQGKYVTNV